MSQPYTCLTHPKKDLREEIVKDEFLGRVLWYIIFNRDFQTNEIELTVRNLARDLSKPRKKVSSSTAGRVILSLVEMGVLEPVKKSSNRSDTSVYKLSPHFEMWSKFLSFDGTVNETVDETVGGTVSDQEIQGVGQKQETVGGTVNETVGGTLSIINNNINTPPTPPQVGGVVKQEPVKFPKNSPEIKLCHSLIKKLKAEIGDKAKFPSKNIKDPEKNTKALQSWATDFHRMIAIDGFEEEEIEAMIEHVFLPTNGFRVESPRNLRSKTNKILRSMKHDPPQSNLFDAHFSLADSRAEQAFEHLLKLKADLYSGCYKITLKGDDYLAATIEALGFEEGIARLEETSPRVLKESFIETYNTFRKTRLPRHVVRVFHHKMTRCKEYEVHYEAA